MAMANGNAATVLVRIVLYLVVVVLRTRARSVLGVTRDAHSRSVYTVNTLDDGMERHSSL